MKQYQFLFAVMKAFPFGDCKMQPDGSARVDLRTGVTLSHSFKDNDKMYMTVEGKKYEIPSHVELNEICRMHLAATDGGTALFKEYANHYLHPVD